METFRNLADTKGTYLRTARGAHLGCAPRHRNQGLLKDGITAVSLASLVEEIVAAQGLERGG